MHLHPHPHRRRSLMKPALPFEVCKSYSRSARCRWRAIASAIDDALQRPGAVTRLPVTPQRLKALMSAGDF